MIARPAFREIDWCDPEALFLAGPGQAAHAFWLDAGPRAVSGWSWMGTGEERGSFPRELPLQRDTDAVAEVPGGFIGGWVGWLGYDGAAARAGAPAVRDDAASENAALCVRHFVAIDHENQRMWLVAADGALDSATERVARWVDAAQLRGANSDSTLADASAPGSVAIARVSPDEYGAAIEGCRQAIRAGDAYQLCLTTRFSLDDAHPAIDPVETYLRLRHSLPAHHGGFVRVGETALLSASPEQFLQHRAGVVRTRPIKGTRPRSADPATDAALARELLASEKERAENVMIVDLMRNDLLRVSVPGSVTAERLLEVESYSAVHQLVSTVAGRTRPGVAFGELLDAAFPAGSMTGAPKLSAMTILHSLEHEPRGVYSGCFGWLGSDGRFDLAMSIRSIVVHPGGAYVGAGGGITWLSETRAEIAEVALKARGPLAALGAVLPPAWADALVAEDALRAVR